VIGRRVTSITSSLINYLVMEEIESFTWRYPTASDPQIPSTPVRVRWRTNREQSGRLECRNVMDPDWKLEQQELRSEDESAVWTTPALPGRYLLRWVAPDSAYVSDTLLITPVMEPKVGFVCPDSILFYWRPVPGVSYYDVYKINTFFLLPTFQTTDTFFIDRNLRPDPA
jgi:hypothetical protein